MENQGRNMAPVEKITPPPRAKSEDRSRLTIMIMKSVGQVRTFKISPRFILLVSLFLLVYFPLSLFLINRYIDLRRDNSVKTERLVELEDETSRNRKTIRRSKQHIAILEDYIHHLENLREQDRTLEKAPVAAERPKEKKPKPTPLEPKPTKGTQEKEIYSDLVDIKDMVIQKEGSRVNANFKLVNIQPGEEPFTGYVHTIAVSNQAGTPKAWPYPKETLKDGVPLNYRRGQVFRIQRFRPFGAKFELGQDAAYPLSLKILVYDQTGTIVLRKFFEVSDVS